MVPSRSDKDIILSPRGWLTDKIISAAQMLLLQFYPNMAGLQPPILQKVHEFEVHCGGVYSDSACREQPLVCGVHSRV